MPNPAKPTALKLMQGNPGKRAINQAEPQPNRPAKCPQPPRGTPEYARKFWLDYAPKVWALGLLTEIDLPAWEMLCEHYNTFCIARADVRKTKRVDEVNGNGAQGTRYSVRVMSDMTKLINTGLSKFGMTPSDRAGMQVAPDLETETDPAEEIMFNSGVKAS